MPAFGPIARRDLIRAFRQAGWDGPIAGTRHEYMTKGGQRVPIPNPHRGDISRPLLGEILRQAGISREEWKGSDTDPDLLTPGRVGLPTADLVYDPVRGGTRPWP